MVDSIRINIIGAGIAGLSAGIYARLNGFEVTIFEMGPKAGGVCSSWEREGYFVNGSINWLVGSAPGIDFYQMWHHLGVLQDNTIHNHSSFIEYRNIDGVDVHFYVEPEKLRKHLKEISPEDHETIDIFIDGIKTFAAAKFPMDRAFELLNAWDWVKVFMGNIPMVVALGKYNQLSIRDFAKKFRSKVLQTAFENFWSAEMSMVWFLMHLSFAANGTAGFPLGGSGKFAERLVKRFIDLGGKIEYNSKVAKIIIEGKTAKGIQLENGQQINSDYIISACDGHTVLHKMLGPKFVDEKTFDSYNSLQLYPPIVYFSAGVRRNFEDLQSSIIGMNIPLKNPMKVGNITHTRASFQIYNFDPTLAPQGKTLITSILDTDYEFWKNLYSQGEDAYRNERAKICHELLASLELEFPDISNQVDFMDTATPITYENWTGNHKGSYEGWLPTPEALKIKLPTHFQNLKYFYMAGHWVMPGGGMPPAAFTGRNCIQLICKEEKIHFEAEV